MIAFFLLFYLKQKEIIFKPKPPLLPTELAPLDAYVKACIEKVSGEAFSIVGTTGGYIYYPDFIEKDANSYLLISPTEHGKMPYWKTLSELRIVPVEFIAEEVERYVNENLKGCLQNFSVFTKQYDIEEKSEPKTDVEFGEESTKVTVNYELKISDKQGRKIADVKSFEVILPYRIKTIHRIAKDIVENELSSKFIEYTAIDLIALDEDIPLNGIEMSCKKKRWRVSEVENKLKTLLRVNLPKIRIGKTSYPDFPPDQPYLAKHYLWNPLKVNYMDFSVGISFSEQWPFYFYVRPNKGGWLESGSQQIQKYLKFICLQMWQFSYDFEFPVVFTIVDRKTGYSFSFAIKVGVEKNYPSSRPVSSESYRFVTDEPTEEEYCSRKQVEMTIFSYDNVSESYLPIDDVDIEFTCLKYTCDMGKTKYQSGGAVALLKTYFPKCNYGIIRARKEGYKEYVGFISTMSKGEASVYLTPLKKVKVSVVKHKYDPDLGTLYGEEKLAEGEVASISVKRSGHESFANFPSEIDEIEFLAEDDFTYNITVYLMKDDKIIGGCEREITFSWNDLVDADEVVFHVLYMDVKTEDDVFELMSQLKKVSELLPLPEIK